MIPMHLLENLRGVENDLTPKVRSMLQEINECHTLKDLKAFVAKYKKEGLPVLKGTARKVVLVDGVAIKVAHNRRGYLQNNAERDVSLTIGDADRFNKMLYALDERAQVHAQAGKATFWKDFNKDFPGDAWRLRNEIMTMGRTMTRRPVEPSWHEVDEFGVYCDRLKNVAKEHPSHVSFIDFLRGMVVDCKNVGFYPESTPVIKTSGNSTAVQ